MSEASGRMERPGGQVAGKAGRLPLLCPPTSSPTQPCELRSHPACKPCRPSVLHPAPLCPPSASPHCKPAPPPTPFPLTRRRRTTMTSRRSTTTRAPSWTSTGGSWRQRGQRRAPTPSGWVGGMTSAGGVGEVAGEAARWTRAREVMAGPSTGAGGQATCMPNRGPISSHPPPCRPTSCPSRPPRCRR